ncbi:2Fe-2S iron-sulfur cluster-binding protein [Streptomyces sp. NPDC023723]|uniref:2Fe-2S iron-sulfur cluster-binding protein n=1 Tax=Streptomyces sp. NPDC023723 TaxID=3154323 RepID=UPI0033F7C39E
MTDDQQGEGTPQGGGSRWDPLPQGDYDDGATAFVQLPEGGIDALLDAAGSPLAAPGHGFVPPQITVAPAAGTDPADTGGWPMPSAPVDGTQWQAPTPGQPSYGDPDAAQQYGSADPAQAYGAARQDPYGTAGHGQYGVGAPYAGHDPHAAQDDRFAYHPGATSQWDFGEAVAEEQGAPAPGHDVTGQWSIPVAGGDLPDESGEFTTSSLVEQWGGTPPATLPGGAPAPWATQAAGAPWGARAGEPETGFGPEYGAGARADFGPDYGAQGIQEAAPEAGAETVQGGAPAPQPQAFPEEQAFAEEQSFAEGQGYPDEQRYHQEQQRYAEEQRYSDGRRFAPEQPGPDERTYPQGQAFPDERPFPDVRPYLRPAAEAGGESVAGPVAESGAEPVPGGTVTDEAQGAQGAQETQGVQEAAEGPAEPPEAPAPADAAETAPEAAEEPVPPVAPAREAPSPEPAAEPDARDATETATEAEPDPDTEAATEAEAEAAEADPAPDPDPVPESDSEPGPPDPAPEEPEGADGPTPPGPLHEEHPLASYVLRVNGTDRPVTDAWIGESLLYVLRERLGLAGAKDGCSQGECGACNVQVDGRLVASCLVPAVTAAGSEVRTVEGLAADGQPSDVQRALARCGAVQCGFCVPGMAMTMHDLLEGNPAPTELETRQALCGNLCRCSGYRGFLRAVDEVVAEREASAEADADAAEAGEARIPHQAGPGAGGVNPSAFDPQGSAGPHPREPHDHPHDHPHGQDDGGQA